MADKVPSLSTVLKSHQCSVTKVRSLVFEALAHSEPLGIKELYNKLDHLMDRASIYRTLDLFEKIGIVKRLQIGWKHKFELSDIFLDHHHHVTCMQCGSIYKFEENSIIEKQLNVISRKMDFSLTEHSLELRGICVVCKRANEF